jgi:hypothetical protein
MYIGIIGNRKYCKVISDIIEKIYNPEAEKLGYERLQTTAFSDSSLEDNIVYEGLLNVSLNNLIQAYFDKKINALVISRESLNFGLMILKFKKLGIDLDDVYIAGRLNEETLNKTKPLDFLMPYYDSDFLPYLEFHIADQCNLNCAACQHFSGLVKKSHYPDFEKFSRDLEELHKYIKDIGRIRILGGEPLMNPDIEKYVALVREIYPYSELYVVTNGILLESMPDSFFETMKNNGARLALSLYPPFFDKLGEWRDFAIERGVVLECEGEIHEFSKVQSLYPVSDENQKFYDCIQANCNNLYEGHIAACFLPFTIHYFNEYFDKHIPSTGAINLYDYGLTTRALKERLLTPFETCRYCADYENIPWRQISNPSTLDDWVV